MPLEIMKLVAYIGSTGAVLGSLWGGGSFVDKHFAHQDDFAISVLMQDQDRNNDALRQIQARIWRLEGNYGFNHSKWPQSAQEELKALEEQKKKIDDHLQRLDALMIQKTQG